LLYINNGNPKLDYVGFFHVKRMKQLLEKRVEEVTLYFYSEKPLLNRISIPIDVLEIREAFGGLV
jgi:hypothetical protein